MEHTKKGLRLLAAMAAAAMTAALLPAFPAAAAGGTVVAKRSFDSDIYDYLLDAADANGDGKLNEYELSLVTEVDLSGIGLKSLKGLAKLPNLSWVDASDNELKTLTTLGKCTSLYYLDVSGNALTGLSGLSGLSSLRELDASGNAISSITALASLEDLESLDLSKNKLKTVSTLGELYGLSTLILDNNLITRMPDLSRWLHVLSARNNQLTDMSFVTSLTRLEQLDLSGNEIPEIPDLSKNTALTVLYLEKNRIDTLRDSSKAAVSQLSSGEVKLLPQMVAGWQQQGDVRSYFTDDKGTYVTGTYTIDGISYTFNEYGELGGSSGTTTGWVEQNGAK